MKIRNIEFYSMIIVLMLSNFLGNGIYSLINSSKQDAPLALIISGLIDLIVLYMFIVIFNYKKELTIKEKVNCLFNKPISYIINISLLLLSILFFIINLYSVISFITSQFLSNTPEYIVGLIFIGLIIFINIKGLNNIAKSIFLFTLITIFFILFSNLNLISYFKPINLLPLLVDGIPYKGISSILTLNITSIFILLIIPANKVDNVKAKGIISTYFISLALMILIITILIGVLGIELVSYYQYPEYIILEKIKIFNFLNKLENVLDIEWIFSLFSACSISMYSICNIINTKKIKYNTKVIIFSVICFTLCLLFFENITQYVNFVYKNYIYILIVVFLTNLIIYIKIKIDKKSILRKI